ncbi:MAG: LysM peptidoglycan-binding domain-containing protein [Ilumatobacter sp.]|nr:LysM peptidoglycan-binding domain-containing protein [Ilumatobacter sp.]
MRGRAGSLLGAALVALAGCASGAADGADSEATTAPTTSVPADSVTTAAATPTPTTVSTDAAADSIEESCTVTVVSGDFLAKISARLDGITVDELQAENRMTDDHIIHPGDELDVCIDNDVDDVTGASRLAPPPAAVRRQQEKLNDLFAPYVIADLAVDGDSGPLTRQLLCAARMGLGLPVSATNMQPGGDDEATLFDATSLSVPAGAAVWSSRWVLVDKTCQVIFTGEGNNGIDNVFPTSTGEPGFETRDSQGVAAFRFDPALDTGGWHDSSRFPVEADNPLNGNMYKPIYFNNGQAIHGANYVPPDPRSKGCARMFPWHQDLLISWLGLSDVTAPTWNESRIGATVTVQGDYRPAD